MTYQYEWREEDGTKLEDGAHIVFVNASYDKEDDKSELAKLMHDFRCSQAKDMFSRPLADKTRKLKETPEGVDTMCKAIEDNNKRIIKMRNEQMALSLLRIGKLSYEEIADVSELTVKEVEKLAETKNHTA